MRESRTARGSYRVVREPVSSPAERLDELSRRDDRNAVTETRREVTQISRDEEVGGRRERDLEEGLVVGIGESARKRLRDDEFARDLDLDQKGLDAFRVESEAWTRQHIAVFIENAPVEEEGKPPESHELHDFARRPMGRPEPGNENVRVENDAQRARRRLFLTSEITLLISLRERPLG